MEEEHKSKCNYTAAKEHFLCFFVVVINKFLQEDSLSKQVQQDNVLRCYSVSRLIQAFRSTLVSVVPSILGLPNIASDI